MWVAMSKIYKAKRDAIFTTFFVVMIILCASISVLAEIFLDSAMRHIIPVILGIVAFFMIILYVRVWYEVDDKNVTIVFGYIRFEIKKSDIINAEKINRLTKNFSLAKRCIELSFGKNERRKFNKVYISPKLEDEFLNELNLRGKSNES